MANSSFAKKNKTEVIVENLTQLLRGPLPGIKVQKSMAPEMHTFEISNAKLRDAGVVLILFPTKTNYKLIFMKRPDYNGVHGGQICFPGGKKETHDKSMQDAAIRECNEELGIELYSSNILGVLTPLHIPISSFTVYPFVAFLPKRPKLSPDPTEVEQVFEIPINNFWNHKNIQTETWHLHGQDIVVPFYQAEKQKIWGATAMITAEFIEIYKKLII